MPLPQLPELPSGIEKAMPKNIRVLYELLSRGLAGREPSIRAHIQELKKEHPRLDKAALSEKLIASTRKQVVTSAAVSSAASVFPGVGTLIALGAIGGQTIFAVERELEMVMGIAMIYGAELDNSERRLKEALVVAGMGVGIVQFEERVLIAGGKAIALSAFRKFPEMLLRNSGEKFLGKLLGKIALSGGMRSLGKIAPFAIGIAIGAGTDYLAVTAMGKAAITYYSNLESQPKPLKKKRALKAPKKSPLKKRV